MSWLLLTDKSGNAILSAMIRARESEAAQNTYRVIIGETTVIDLGDQTIDGRFVNNNNPLGTFQTENFGYLHVDLARREPWNEVVVSGESLKSSGHKAIRRVSSTILGVRKIQTGRHGLRGRTDLGVDPVGKIRPLIVTMSDESK